MSDITYKRSYWTEQVREFHNGRWVGMVSAPRFSAMIAAKCVKLRANDDPKADQAWDIVEGQEFVRARRRVHRVW